VRVLEVAEKMLHNLQKGLVESTISTAAGLEEGSPYPSARALTYYESHHNSRSRIVQLTKRGD
jgi:hypothetical protein